MARLIGRLNDRISQDLLPVLTGAGASVGFGFPMMNQAIHLFSEHLRQLPEQNPSPGASRRGRLKHYKNWIDEEARNLEVQQDLETFLIALDRHIAYLRRGQVHGLARRILGDLDSRPLIASDALGPLDALLDLRFAYMDFVHHQYGGRLSEQARKSAMDSFEVLASVLPIPYSLFTTNYDTVTEAVPSLLGKTRIDGFTSYSPEGPEIWNDEGFENYGDPDRDMPVFHLHGSASWIVIDGEIRRYPQLGRLRDPAESVLIYPGQSTKDQGIPDDLLKPLRSASDYFSQAMANQRRLVAIGYSFRDEGIARIIDRAAAYAQRSIRIHVITPDLGPDIDRLFRRANVRGHHIEAGFEDVDVWGPALSHQLQNSD